MGNGNNIPKLTGKDEIKLQKKTVYNMSCPKCEEEMDVTSVNPNTYIECQSCQNVTWRPDYNPPWWAKTKNFVASLIFTLVVGIAAGIASNLIFEKYKENKTETGNSNVNKENLNPK